MSDDSKFPECFPRNPKICSVQGNAFFDCIDKHADKTDELDTSANARALAACLAEKKLYVSCMETFEIKNPPRRFRVQTEYRKEIAENK